MWNHTSGDSSLAGLVIYRWPQGTLHHTTPNWWEFCAYTKLYGFSSFMSYITGSEMHPCKEIHPEYSTVKFTDDTILLAIFTKDKVTHYFQEVEYLPFLV